MKRWTLPISLLLFAGLALAQQSSPAMRSPGSHDFDSRNPDAGDSSPATDGALGTQLIAWTVMQEPRPVNQPPQPVPPPESRSGQSQEPQPSQTQDQSRTPNQQQPEPDTAQTALSLTGTVMKAAGKFVLQTADSTAYILDDQDKAKSYEGKRVKVTGTLDRPTGILRISSIELLS
jgi:hypothetical protein